VVGNFFGLSGHIHKLKKFHGLNKNKNLISLFYLFWKKYKYIYLIWNLRIHFFNWFLLLDYVHYFFKFHIKITLSTRWRWSSVVLDRCGFLIFFIWEKACLHTYVDPNMHKYFAAIIFIFVNAGGSSAKKSKGESLNELLRISCDCKSIISIWRSTGTSSNQNLELSV